MSRRVFVGKSYSDGLYITAIVFAILGFSLAIVAALAEAPEVLVGILAAGGAVAMFVAVLRYKVISRNRRWITPTDTGFILEDPRGEFEFTDEMVSDLATWAKLIYSNGVPNKNRRTGSFILTAGEASVTFEFKYDYPLGEADPLGEMLDRVFKKLVDQANAALARGGRLHGDGWSLDRHQVTYFAGREEVSVPVTELSVVDITDGQLCVWRKDEAAAIVKVKPGSPNALVMGRVLQGLLPEDRSETEPADGLGRIIFERDQSIKGCGLFAGIAFMLVGVLVGIGFVAWWIADGDTTGLLGFILILGCGLAAGAFWAKRVNIFRCHAFGVARTTPKGVAKMQYKSIGGFTYSGVRQYVNGAYAGTTVTLQFDPLEDSDAEPLSYTATFKNADEELDNLRDFISRVVATHMLRRLREGQAVRWTPSMLFLPDGLQVTTPAGWFGKKSETFVIPYGSIVNYDITDGVFRLAMAGSDKWVMEEMVNQANFFPGFYLLLMILHPPPDESGEGEGAGEGSDNASATPEEAS